MHTLSIIADNFSLVLVSFWFVLVFGTLVFFFSCYRRCPSDKILVIYGKNVGDGKSFKCIHRGAAFVWPIFQAYQYLDLTPIPLAIKLEGVPSRQKIRVNMPATVTIGISTKDGVMENAADRMLGLDLNQIRMLGQEIIYCQMRLAIASIDIESVNSDPDLLLEKIVARVEVELAKVGLRLININIQNITWDSN